MWYSIDGLKRSLYHSGFVNLDWPMPDQQAQAKKDIVLVREKLCFVKNNKSGYFKCIMFYTHQQQLLKQNISRQSLHLHSILPELVLPKIVKVIKLGSSL